MANNKSQNTRVSSCSLRLAANRFFASQALICALLLFGTSSFAQDKVRYTGTTLVNADYHHGQLSPVIGVHNIQTLRANREHPEMAEGSGWAYNHASMLAYWNNKFYLEYLSDSIGEHIPPSQSLLQSSVDGYKWTKPVVVFPRYKIADGTKKIDQDGVEYTAKDLYAVMHQRMGFYVSKKNRLLVLGFYGICMHIKDNPNDGNGIGRVVREVKADGSFGPIYFIRYNHGYDAKNTLYPFYAKSKDKGFVEACNELMATPQMMMQWVEEADRNDALIPLKKQYKAFNYYLLPDGRAVGLWKQAVSSISNDGGKTWPESATRAPGFVNGSAKIWGQRLSDGNYATVYNPSEFRWPLAISTSTDGLEYTNLHLVHGEISPMRYGGNEKSYGPQYVRGIMPGNGTPPDGNMWLTYSMNKEDIWVAKVPVPVQTVEDGAVNDIFNALPNGRELSRWNIYSPLWAPVAIENYKGAKVLALRDSDPYDYAKAERVIPLSQKGTVEFEVEASQNNHGTLNIELQNPQGTACIRIVFDADGTLWSKAGAKPSGNMDYKAGESYRFKIDFNTQTRSYTMTVSGRNGAKTGMMFVPVEAVSRVVFRTGEIRRTPNVDTPAQQEFDLPNAGVKIPEAVYFVKGLKTN
jgi:hypothetical protein